MSANIQIAFQNATVTSTALLVALTNASYSVAPPSSFGLAGTLPYTALTIGDGEIAFGEQAEAVFNGVISASIDVVRDSTPSITVTNFSGFSGTVTATWNTASGPMSQPLVSGLPMYLAGILASAG